MNFRSMVMAGGILFATAISSAQEGQQTYPQVTPIFHELVLFSLPSQFDLTPPEHLNATSYLRETVLKGETIEKRTQMITVTGYKKLASKPGISPERFGQTIAAGFQKACPTTFAAKKLVSPALSGAEAYLALIGCGSVPDAHGQQGATHNETAMILVIAGDEDYYTVQWAERSAASTGLASMEDAKWQQRFRQLQPIRVCPRVEGEAAPFASCLKQ